MPSIIFGCFLVATLSHYVYIADMIKEKLTSVQLNAPLIKQFRLAAKQRGQTWRYAIDNLMSAYIKEAMPAREDARAKTRSAAL